MNQNKFKLALVTGASSGIGEAVSYLLAQQGINLLITGRNIEKLESLRQELALKVEVIAFAADLSNRSGLENVIKNIHEFKPDLVINNAGVGLYGDILDTSTQSQMNILEVDGKAVLELTIESAKTMVSSGNQGTILNVSSAAAFQIFPYFAVYAATKAFVNHFSVSLDYELRPKGVRVLASCPGMVATNFGRRSGGQKSSSNAVMPVAKAAKEIWRQICKGKQVHTFDLRYRFATALSQFIPNRFLAKMLSRIIQSRMK